MREKRVITEVLKAMRLCHKMNDGFQSIGLVYMGETSPSAIEERLYHILYEFDPRFKEDEPFDQLYREIDSDIPIKEIVKRICDDKKRIH